jgi:hypothetical protein
VSFHNDFTSSARSRGCQADYGIFIRPGTRKKVTIDKKQPCDCTEKPVFCRRIESNKSSRIRNETKTACQARGKTSMNILKPVLDPELRFRPASAVLRQSLCQPREHYE